MNRKKNRLRKVAWRIIRKIIKAFNEVYSYSNYFLITENHTIIQWLYNFLCILIFFSLVRKYFQARTLLRQP